jgi:uncharacterized protein with FMN-binding domain
VRKGTKSFIGILSLGVVAAGYQVGQAAEVSSGFSASAPISGGETLAAAAPAATPEATLETTTPSAPVPESTAAASAEPASVSTPKATVAAPAPAPVSTPKATVAAPAPVSTPSAPASSGSSSGTTKTGTAIPYRFGTVQVSVTKANGKITAVNLLQQGATGGRQAAFSYLVQYAIQANGTDFGNLSGATYTVDAFKQSLESALAKF